MVTLSKLHDGWVASKIRIKCGLGKTDPVPPLNIAALLPGWESTYLFGFVISYLRDIWYVSRSVFPVLEVGTFLRKMNRLGKRRFWHPPPPR